MIVLIVLIAYVIYGLYWVTTHVGHTGTTGTTGHSGCTGTGYTGTIILDQSIIGEFERLKEAKLLPVDESSIRLPKCETPICMSNNQEDQLTRITKKRRQKRNINHSNRKIFFSK
ncbi:Hypothetical protein HVR_LOCUS85 [uncultured virus]|nr:Hypothetical protein HVR_LOCUS85 [uncultured virus]